MTVIFSCLLFLFASCTTTATGSMTLKNREDKREVIDLIIQASLGGGFIIDTVNERAGVITLSHTDYSARVSLFVKNTESDAISVDINSAYTGSELLFASAYAESSILHLCKYLTENVTDADLFINGNPYIKETPYARERRKRGKK